MTPSESTLIGAWAVDRRDRHVVQSQVDSELCAMMNEVAHHKAAKHRGARQREDWLSAGQQSPFAHHNFVAHSFQRIASLLHAVVKTLEELGARLGGLDARGRLAHRRDVQAVLIENVL